MHKLLACPALWCTLVADRDGRGSLLVRLGLGFLLSAISMDYFGCFMRIIIKAWKIKINIIQAFPSSEIKDGLIDIDVFGTEELAGDVQCREGIK